MSVSTEQEPKIGDIVEMDNGTLGIERGEIINDEKMGKAIKWPDGDIEQFDMESFTSFDGKIVIPKTGE